MWNTITTHDGMKIDAHHTEPGDCGCGEAEGSCDIDGGTGCSSAATGTRSDSAFWLFLLAGLLIRRKHIGKNKTTVGNNFA